MLRFVISADGAGCRTGVYTDYGERCETVKDQSEVRRRFVKEDGETVQNVVTVGDHLW